MLVTQIKDNLRISHNKLDDEILSTIKACQDDLERVGISVDESDDLTVQAIKLYCRWAYNFENQADRYLRAYEGLRDAMSMNLERRAPDV